MSGVKVLNIPQIMELAECTEKEVRKSMRRGTLPSQECHVVREWIKERWSRNIKQMIREELNSESRSSRIA